VAELPEHPEFNDTLACVYLKKGLPSLAIPPLRVSIAKAPDNPSFHYHLGLAYQATGDKAAAKQSLERALRLKPDFDGAADAKKALATIG
jgi:Tfp pilus assembly protein PilF